MISMSPIPTASSIDFFELAKRAEELGFESIWAPEQHTLPVATARPVPREWGDIVDPFIALAMAAAVTSTLKLGTAVCVITERHPVTLAKEVATLDMYSGGRFLFGIGTGACEEEALILGNDFPHRWTQAREAVGAMKELWTKDQSEYHGVYYDFPPVYHYPKPVQKPHPPVLLGSKAPNVFKRTVAYGDGWIPIGVNVEDVRHGREELDRLAAAAGRDPASIEITVIDPPADRGVLDQYAAVAGADRAVPSIALAGKPESLTQLEEMARAVLR